MTYFVPISNAEYKKTHRTNKFYFIIRLKIIQESYTLYPTEYLLNIVLKNIFDQKF